MFPGVMPTGANKEERQLIKCYKKLRKSDRKSLIAFAEFLVSRMDSSLESEGVESDNKIAKQPVSIPRPGEESVIKAIKRLTATYPMVDKENILHPISDLMTSHIMQGEAAAKVIDELEAVFLKEYDSLIRSNNNSDKSSKDKN